MTILATPLTEIDAVNEILGTSTESPVTSLDDQGDAANALKILRITSVEVQTEGWFFNEEFSVPLAPTTSGEISLPANILKIDTSGTNLSTPAVQRGARLYNKEDRSYVFDSEVTVDWVLGLAYEELPSSARNYIMIRSARKYQDRYGASDAMHQYIARDELEARVTLKSEDMDSRDSNMLSGSTFTTNLQGRT